MEARMKTKKKLLTQRKAEKGEKREGHRENPFRLTAKPPAFN
jgi:hypothetical protein